MKTARDMFRFCIVSVGISLGMAMPQQPAGTKEAGSITTIECTALFKNDEKSPEIRLDPKRDKGRTLHVGERLKCLSDGAIKILLYGEAHSIDKSLGWYPIPDRNSSNDEGGGGRPGELTDYHDRVMDRYKRRHKSAPGRTSELFNFAGVWVMDKSKSQGLSLRLQGADKVTWTVTQTDQTIQIDQKVEGGQPPPFGAGGGGGTGGGGGRDPGGPPAPAVYNLDGTETNMEMGQATASLKARWSGGMLELARKTTFNGPNGEVTSTNSQKLSLSRDGKVLTVVIHNENPRGATDLTMVFNKQ